MMEEQGQQEEESHQQHNHRHHVVVIVLGDVGRSPRMQYHALSLLQEGYRVSLVGYHGEELIPALEDKLRTQQQSKQQSKQHSQHSFHVIRFTPWSPSTSWRSTCFPLQRLLYFVGRVCGLVGSLVMVLVSHVSLPVHCVLVQNPPAIPLLFIAYLYCQMMGIFFPIIGNNNNNNNHETNATNATNATTTKTTTSSFQQQQRRRPRLIIDWHNLGYTMLKDGSVLQQCAKLYEQTMAPLADGHLCVTKAMKSHLQTEFKINHHRHKKNHNPQQEQMMKLKKKNDDNHDGNTVDDDTSNTNDIISVLYDSPPTMFRPLSLEEQHDFWYRLQHTDTTLQSCPWIKELISSNTSSTSIQRTLFTERITLREETRRHDNHYHHDDDDDDDNQVTPTVVSRKGRPVLVTSSTSWTEDEDFGILLDALVALESRLVTTAAAAAASNTATDNNNNNNMTDFRMLVLVTGKGPLKEYYQERISKLSFHYISIHTVWLSPGDYPQLLACADLGISLHTSTSGLDLPMKILDLYGCETPVCALQFDCLHELVQDTIQGRTFTSAQELTIQLYDLLVVGRNNHDDEGDDTTTTTTLAAAPHSFGLLADYSNNLKGRSRWNTNWKGHALPLLKPSISSSSL